MVLEYIQISLTVRLLKLILKTAKIIEQIKYTNHVSHFFPTKLKPYTLNYNLYATKPRCFTGKGCHFTRPGFPLVRNLYPKTKALPVESFLSGKSF